METDDVCRGIRTKIEKYLTQNIQHDNGCRPANLIQMIERSADDDEQDEEPEEADHLDVASA